MGLGSWGESVGLKTVFYVLMFLCLASTVFAQGLSRNDVIQAAEQSAVVKAARARLNLAQSQATAAGVPISASLGGGYSLSGSSPDTTGLVSTNDAWKISLNLSFAGLFGIALETRMLADINFERAKRAFNAAQLKATRNAIALWHTARHGFLALELANTSLQTAKLVEQAAETRFQAGGISINGRENASLAVERADLEVQKAKLFLQSAQLQLEINFALKSEAVLDHWQALPDTAGITQLEWREDVFEAQSALTTAEFERSKTNQAVLPSAKLEAGISGSSGTLSLSVNQNLASNLNYSFSNTPSSSTEFSVGISISVPLDLGAWNALEPVTNNVTVAQNNLALVVSSAKADIVARRAALGLSHSSLELANHTQEFNQKQLERTKTRFNAGLITPLELQKTELEVLKGRLDVFDAQAELDLSVMDVHQATAVMLEELK